MASPKKNVAYDFTIGLVDSTDTGAFKVNPTIAAGDFKVSTDGGAFTNLATLPVVTPAGSIAVKIDLSAAEMNGDKIAVQCTDVAGAEWDDGLIFIDATISSVDDVKTRVDLLLDTYGIIKNSALANFEFLMVSNDHFTPKTGLTITAERSINGAAFGAMANSAVEVSDGIYKIDLAAADTNGDIITYKFSAPGADDTFVTVRTTST